VKRLDECICIDIYIFLIAFFILPKNMMEWMEGMEGDVLVFMFDDDGV